MFLSTLWFTVWKRLIKYSSEIEIKDNSDLSIIIKTKKLIELKDLLKFNNKLNQIKKTDEYNELNIYASSENDKIFLFQVLYPKIFQQIIMNNTNIIKINTKLDLIDIIYFFKYKDDLKKIIKYFYLQLLTQC